MHEVNNFNDRRPSTVDFYSNAKAVQRFLRASNHCQSRKEWCYSIFNVSVSISIRKWIVKLNGLYIMQIKSKLNASQVNIIWIQSKGKQKVTVAHICQHLINIIYSIISLLLYWKNIHSFYWHLFVRSVLFQRPLFGFWLDRYKNVEISLRGHHKKPSISIAQSLKPVHLDLSCITPKKSEFSKPFADWEGESTVLFQVKSYLSNILST